MDELHTGTLPGSGTFRCRDCDYTLSLAARDHLPECPSCGGHDFARASLFAVPGVATPPAGGEDGDLLASVRANLREPGQYLVFGDGERTQVVALGRDWTRIGRSLAADVRFDDPTVSRRHALVVRGPDGVRVLDDRSLNGVWVNGRRVEWSALADGDEILVGRHSLWFVDLPRVGEQRVAEHAAPLAGS